MLLLYKPETEHSLIVKGVALFLMFSLNLLPVFLSNLFTCIIYRGGQIMHTVNFRCIMDVSVV